jgi:hypothetical protein
MSCRCSANKAIGISGGIPPAQPSRSQPSGETKVFKAEVSPFQVEISAPSTWNSC